MQLKSIKYIGLAVILLQMISCKKEIGSHQPTGNSSAVPAQVSNIQVKNGKGKVVLTYTVPKDDNLLYVKANYTIKTGEAEVKASYYSDSLVLEGFGDTLEHEVKVYAVSRSEVVSAPTVVKVKPLESPIWDVFRGLVVENTFGGYHLAALNPTKADLSLLVFTKNKFNEWEVDNNKSVYTRADSIQSVLRGLDTIDYTYGFAVRDRWGNITDTVFRTVHPLFEKEFPKSKFKEFRLPGDAQQVTNGAALAYAWDTKFGWPYTSFTLQTAAPFSDPHMVTIDMGSLGKVSRVWIRPFPEGTRYYFLSTMKRFEIYGSANPNLNGSLDNSWKLLGSYTVIKPSGLPYGTDDATDQATAAAGFSWDADVNAPPVRYLRIRCLENFAGGTAQSINELTVYGNPQ